MAILFAVFSSLTATTTSSKLEASAQPAPQHDGEVLIVLHDAGETYGLQPVIEQLQTRSASFHLLVMGTARTIAKDKKLPRTVDLNTDCRVGQRIDETSDSTATLSPSDLQRVRRCVGGKKVIVGAAAQSQVQVAQDFIEQGARVYAFFDGFAVPEPKTPAGELLGIAHEVWVATQSIRRELQRRPTTTAEIVTVGQPSTESWRIAGERVNAADVRQQLNLSLNKPVVLYAGGYGEGYDAAFRQFVQSMKDRTNLQIIVSLHPKVDGAAEQKILREEGAAHIRVMPKTIPTRDAAVVSDVIVTHRSTVGVQARFMNKPVIFYDIPGTTYRNIAIERHWAEQTTTDAAFRKALNAALKQKAKNSGDIYRQTGIPKQAVELILRRLSKGVKSQVD